MQTVDEWAYDRVMKWHKIMLAKQELPAVANQIFETMKDDDRIYELNEFISWVNQNLGLTDPELIQSAIDQLIKEKKLISVEKNGKVFLRKMTYL
jgi:hypothetical protein